MRDDTDRPVIDPDRFDVVRRACGGDENPAVLGELIDEYATAGAGRIEALRVALAAGDATEVERLAHGLQGSSASFGAVVMAALAQELEEAARRGDLDGAPGALRRLEREFKRAAVALRLAAGP